MDVDAVTNQDGTSSTSNGTHVHATWGTGGTGKGPGNQGYQTDWGQNWGFNGYQNQDWWGGESWGGNADEIDQLQKGKGKGFKGYMQQVWAQMAQKGSATG